MDEDEWEAGKQRMTELVRAISPEVTVVIPTRPTSGLFLIALFEPWPVRLRQGPDTTFARRCYAELLGGSLPVDVTRVYCRKEWGFGGDSITSIRFSFRATSTVDAIVDRLQLQALPPGEREEARYLNGPRWWPERIPLSRVPDVYERRGVEFLWVDRDAMEAYYQRAYF